MKTSSKASKELIKKKIPFLRSFNEEGIIETTAGIFSKCYLIQDIDIKNAREYTTKGFNRKFKDMLNGMPEDVSFQFVIHNRIVKEKSFFERILKDADKRPGFSGYVKAYNDVIRDNADIGHNNVKKDNYLVLSVKADLPEDAAKRFKELAHIVEDLFYSTYRMEISALSLDERFSSLKSMLNPGNGEKTDFLKKIKGTGITSKDLMMPKAVDNSQSHKDYMVLNGRTYTRSFFINLTPKKTANTIISDITSISSSMLLSIQYEHVPEKFALSHFSDKAAENMRSVLVSKRDSLSDRKLKATEEFMQMINHTEDDYFNSAAFNVFKQGVASETKVYAASIVITLYADEKETLERDTQLLYISADKFAVQIKCLDLLQLEGFQSSLPLCSCRVDVKRIYNLDRLANMHPLNIQEILKRDGLFFGLNAINDNLIIYNRRNFSRYAGIIAGTKNSGKTFQNKREIFNALISTDDRICIITDTDEYDGFVLKLGGEIIDDPKTNMFEKAYRYDLNDKSPFYKSLMLEAYFKAVIKSHKDDFADMSLDEPMEDALISLDVKNLMDAEHSGILSFDYSDKVIDYIERNSGLFEIIGGTLKFIKPAAFDFLGTAAALELYKAKSPESFIAVMDFLWNRSLDDKKDNTSSWLFADPVDSLLHTEQGLDYLLEYINKCKEMKTILTFVINDSAKLVSEKKTMIRLEELISACGYFKLLNQGAIERDKYINLLNIPGSLINYIINVDYGKGLIITPSQNIAFDDNFYDSGTDNEFYTLFKRSI